MVDVEWAVFQHNLIHLNNFSGFRYMYALLVIDFMGPLGFTPLS